MYKSPRKIFKVIVWKSLNKKNVYVFDTSEKEYTNEIVIKKDIYNDDSIETVLSKIGIYITKNDKFQIYAWTKTNPILFSIKKPKWKGYNINPFLTSNLESEELKEPVDYEYQKKGLFTKYNVINVAFSSDIPNQIHKYYFNTNNKISIKQNNKREELLQSIAYVNDDNVEILPEYYTRINYHCKLNNILLAETFDKIHTSNHIDMIQWIEDSSKILYKLSKENRINKELFMNITNIDKINQNHVINLFSIYNKRSYCKIIIQSNDLNINYVLDARQYNKWKDIKIHHQRMINILENMLKQKLKLQEIAVNSGIKINIANSSFKLLTEKISKQIDIFNVVKKNSKNIVCTYKRSSNYNQNTEIYEYIRSRLNLGITNVEVADELTNLGISGNTLQIVNDEIDIIHKGIELNERDSIKIKDNGTILVVSPRFYGYDISIVNSYNIQEMRYLIFWLSKIISQTVDKKVEKVQEQTKPSKSSTSSNSSLSVASSISSYNSNGGSNKKDNYLITMLQQTDKELFGEYYARNKCQSHVQPVVFSKEHKEVLERGNKMIFDNVIEYGSNPNNLNYYACPKLWCPQSKIPLSVKSDGKCPLDDEEPIKMYKDLDKDKRSYVKLIKPNDKGMCVPCCGKNPTTQVKINNCMSYLNKNNNQIQNDDKKDDDNYLINHTAPIEEGRYGTLPEYLHNLLSDEDHKNCIGSLNTKNECFIRKGVKQSTNNSIIHAIMEIFQIKPSELRKKLDMDLTTYVSLDNGNICKSFIDITYGKRYVKQMKNKKIEINEMNMKIYASMMKYIDYVLSSDMTFNKDPQYILPLVYYLFEVNLIIWEKTNDISLVCNNTVFSKIDLKTKFAMIIKEGNYYEPIVLKKRSSNDKYTFKLNNYSKLKHLIEKCGYKNKENSYFNNLYELNNWIDNNINANNEKFKISKILLNNDLSIDKILTKGNLLLQFPKIGSSYLERFINDMKIKKENILFVNNIQNKEYNINVSKNDLQLFVDKCQTLKINVSVGEIYKNDVNMIQIYSKIKISDKNDVTSDTIIHIDKLNKYHDIIKTTELQTKKWYELQKYVAKTIMKKGNKTSFANHPDKEIIDVILEEIPENSNDIKRWISNIIIQTKYDYLSSAIQNKSEFVFAQNALVKNGEKILPNYLLKYHRSLPNEYGDIEITEDSYNVDKVLKDEDIDQPSLLKGTVKKLNTKWNKNKKMYWSNMVYLDMKYNINTISEFVEWLSIYIGNNQLTYETVRNTSKSIYMNMLNDKKAMYEIFHDTSYYNEWIKRGKKYSTINMFMEKKFNKLSLAEKQAIVEDILNSGELYPTDIDMSTISQLLNISILILQRGVYGEFNEQYNRGDINDLKLSSVFFGASNINERPLIIFNKVCDKSPYCAYYLVVDKMNPSNLYITYDEVPEDIKKLIALHN